MKRVVLTGGPGAGKTAVLELVRRDVCQHVVVLAESASIVFGGGFPRRPDLPARLAAQRAIGHVQRELEWLVEAEGEASVALCDRGTLDGLAYWPGPEADFFAALGSTLERELARYTTVIHLRTPPPGEYNHRNPLRRETPEEAARLDARIAAIWAQHPRRFFVQNAPAFLDKARAALALIRAELPACCQAPGRP